MVDTVAIARSVANASIGVGPVNSDCTYGDPLFPNPITCFSQMVPATALFYYKSLPWQGVRLWLQELWEWHYLSFNMTLLQIFHILAIASLFTSIRYLLNELLLKCIPVWYNITCKEDKQKFPEAAFRFLVYTWLWCWSCYIVVDNNYLTDLMSTFFGWLPGTVVPPSTYWLYMVELGFYVHLVYATIYVELIRKDFYVMLLHHGLTIALLFFSYGVRLHRMGILVLFIHDFGDIWLELSKVTIYFKYRNGKEHAAPEICANCTFTVFVLQWVLFRLYWFPTKLLYSTTYVSLCYYSDGPFYVPLNSMLWVLYLLHIYWFYFISLLVVRVVTGQELIDNREDEKEPQQQQQQTTN